MKILKDRKVLAASSRAGEDNSVLLAAVIDGLTDAKKAPYGFVGISEIGEATEDNIREANRRAADVNKSLQPWLCQNRTEFAPITDPRQPDRKEKVYVSHRRLGGNVYVGMTFYPEGRLIKRKS